jgi:hypothetical protein
MDTPAKPPAPPLTIDMKCGCGASLYIDCKTFSEYINASALLGLAKAWTEAHRGCSHPRVVP